MNRKKGSTTFLKAVVFLIVIPVLAMCFWVPKVAGRDAAAHPESAYLQYPFIICSYILAIAFFVAVYQTFKLLTYIDGNKAFTELSLHALMVIKKCAITICTLIVVGSVFVAIFLEGDRTAVMMLGLLGTLASTIIATFANLLQKLLKETILRQVENELTV